jgi:hypothetical protein
MRHLELLHGKPPPRKNPASRMGTPEAVSSQQSRAEDTTRAAALEEFGRAKLAYHAATLAVMAGLPFAAEQVSDAVAALNRARAGLARAGEDAC